MSKPARALGRLGWALRRIAVDGEGRLAFADLVQALSTPTGLVSVMLANNETGVLQDVARTADVARSRGAVMHTDAVQALGKVPVDFGRLGVHAMSLSAPQDPGSQGCAARS